jgi:hypothetical protein
VTTFNEREFSELCRHAAVHLRLDKPEAIGAGGIFAVDGVECQLFFVPVSTSAQLVCELGDPAEHAQADLYRELFEIQSFFVGHIDAMFLRDPINETILFTVRMPLHPELQPEAFAESITVMVKQVRAWQDTVLQGKFIDYERELHDLTAELGQFVHQPLGI